MVIESLLRFLQPQTSIMGKFFALNVIWPAIRLDRRSRTHRQN
jgi:hypothetical protein